MSIHLPGRRGGCRCGRHGRRVVRLDPRGRSDRSTRDPDVSAGRSGRSGARSRRNACPVERENERGRRREPHGATPTY